MASKHTGRPSAYRPEFAAQAKKLCELGATDAELAEFFQTTITTIKNWKAQFPEFLAASKLGKEAADERVSTSLYNRAMGYSHEAVKIFMPAGAKEPVMAPYVEHVPPDTTACIFWLKNRRPDLWRDVSRQEHSGPNGGPIQTEDVNDSDRAKALAAFVAKTGAAK